MQDEYIWRNAHKGVDFVTAGLARLGYPRSRETVQRRANRIGVSLLRYEICSCCGARVSHTSKGLCASCHTEQLVEGAKGQNTWLQNELRRNDRETARTNADLIREYDRYRKSNERLRKKIEQQGKQYGD